MKTYKFETIEPLDGTSLPAQITMRYRLATTPDIDANYTVVTTTKDYLGVTVHDMQFESLPAGEYVIHQYFTADGPDTGSKFTVKIEEDAIPDFEFTF